MDVERARTVKGWLPRRLGECRVCSVPINSLLPPSLTVLFLHSYSVRCCTPVCCNSSKCCIVLRQHDVSFATILMCIDEWIWISLSKMDGRQGKFSSKSVILILFFPSSFSSYSLLLGLWFIYLGEFSFFNTWSHGCVFICIYFIYLLFMCLFQVFYFFVLFIFLSFLMTKERSLCQQDGEGRELRGWGADIIGYTEQQWCDQLSASSTLVPTLSILFHWETVSLYCELLALYNI